MTTTKRFAWLPAPMLKTRMTAIVVFIAFLTSLLLGAVALFVVQRDMQKSISDQQYVLLSTVASALDQKFELRRATLRAVADGLPREYLDDPRLLQDYLMRRKSLKSVFDNLSVFDADGTLAATLNNPAIIGKLNVAQRDYFADTFREKKATVSAPFVAQILKRPMLVMTYPILDANNRMRMILAATIDLQQQNFLGQFSETGMGRTGHMFIISADGIVVEHTVRSAVLKSVQTIEGDKRVFERALAGYEGTAEGRNLDGKQSLYAFKRLTATNWIVGAVYPADEAFAPVYKLRHSVWLAGLVLALLAGALVWLITKQQLQPLEAFRMRVAAMRAGQPYEPSSIALREDEIGELVTAFEGLIAQLAENRERLQTITDNMPVLIAYIDADQRYRFSNRCYFDWYGVAPEALQGRSVRELVGEAGYAEVQPSLERAYAGERVSLERKLLKPSGETLHMSATYIPHLGESGTVQGVYLMALDITARKQLELELREQARHDPLTGLPNRLELMSRLTQAAARSQRSRKPFALLFLDLDGFKEVNDTYGHPTGDALLRTVAARLQDCVRKSDTVARYGGDEFTIVVENFDDDYNAVLVARKLIAAMVEPIHVNGHELHITCSVGIAVHAGAQQRVEDLLAEADTAMYTAKAMGKNDFFVAPHPD